MSHKARILLVDDLNENLIALEAILATLGQEIVSVRSGEAALEALRSHEFAIILLDVLMPGMDGFETAANIKRYTGTRDVPIIFLTAAGASRSTRSAGTRRAGWTTSPSPSTPGCCGRRWRSSSTCTSRTYSCMNRPSCCDGTRTAPERAVCLRSGLLAEMSLRLSAIEVAAAGLTRPARSEGGRGAGRRPHPARPWHRPPPRHPGRSRRRPPVSRAPVPGLT